MRTAERALRPAAISTTARKVDVCPRFVFQHPRCRSPQRASKENGTMRYQRHARTILAAAALAFAHPALAPAQTSAAAPKTEAGAASHDGQHDFDWMHGN